MDKSAFDYDQSLPVAITEVGKREQDGVTIRDITYRSPAKGADPVLAYIVTPPASEDAPKPPFAGVLWVHWFEPRDQHSNRDQFLDEAIILAREGVVSVLPDGFWSTTPAKWYARPGYVWKTDFEHDRDLSIRQVNEIRRGLDLLLAQEHVDKERIAFVGHDFGAMYGAVMAGFDRRVQGYVLMAGTYSFSDWFMYGSKLEPDEQKAYIEKMKVLDPTRWIKDAAPAKLYFQFAHSDYYIPERAAMVFFDAASEPKEIAWYDAQHDLKDIENDSGRDRLNWLRAQLGLASKEKKAEPAKPAPASDKTKTLQEPPETDLTKPEPPKDNKDK